MAKSRKKKSKYQGVYWTTSNGEHFWSAKYRDEVTKQYVSISKYPPDDEGEREAAKSYDKKLISLGKEPVNILKKSN